MNLANWDLVCRPKEFGGLGVKDLANFNKALLMKWIWYWQKSEQKMWKPIFQGTGLSESLMPDSTLFTGALQQSQGFWETAVTHICAQDDQISLWNHNWGHGVLKHELRALYTHATDISVNLKDAMQGPIRDCFQQTLTDEAEEELQIIRGYLQRVVIHTSQEQDDIRWNRSKTRTYRVKSAYRALKDKPIIASHVHRLWKLRVPPRIQVFGWLLVNNRLLTIDNLRKRGFPITNRCVMCYCDAESAVHMVEHCSFATEMYRRMDITTTMRTHTIDALLRLENNKKARGTLLVAMFVIWRERCARIFSDTNKNLEELIEQVTDLLQRHGQQAGGI